MSRSIPPSSEDVSVELTRAVLPTYLHHVLDASETLADFALERLAGNETARRGPGCSASTWSSGARGGDPTARAASREAWAADRPPGGVWVSSSSHPKRRRGPGKVRERPRSTASPRSAPSRATPRATETAAPPASRTRAGSRPSPQTPASATRRVPPRSPPATSPVAAARRRCLRLPPPEARLAAPPNPKRGSRAASPSADPPGASSGRPRRARRFRSRNRRVRDCCCS